MLVSFKKQFIFTKTAKTAGTSVEFYFEPYCMPKGEWMPSHERDEYISETGIIGYRGKSPHGKLWINHMPAKAIKEQLGTENWDGFYKFCIIRNPFDKLVSAYHHNERRRGELLNLNNLRHKIRQAIRPTFGNNDIDRFRSWISHGGHILDRDKYFIDENICVDYFIRFEQLVDGVQHVCDELDLPFDPDKLPKLKGGMRPGERTVAEYYDNGTIELVRKRYAFEIEKFGYALPE